MRRTNPEMDRADYLAAWLDGDSHRHTHGTYHLRIRAELAWAQLRAKNGLTQAWTETTCTQCGALRVSATEQGAHWHANTDPPDCYLAPGQAPSA